MTDLDRIEALVGPLPKGMTCEVYLSDYRDKGHTAVTNEFAMELADAALAEAYAAIKRLKAEVDALRCKRLPCHEAEVAQERYEKAEIEVKRLQQRIAYVTVDCDEFNLRDGRCYDAVTGDICLREPQCHDADLAHREKEGEEQ